jgi:hypothetical protein
MEAVRSSRAHVDEDTNMQLGRRATRAVRPCVVNVSREYNRGAMTRISRLAATLVLAVMLPLQGWAAACVQICALVQQHHVEGHEHSDSGVDVDERQDSDHCTKSAIGAGKCCQAHMFFVQLPEVSVAVSIPSFERNPFIPRWTSFIPEEPNPPPIATAPIA